MLRLSYPGTDLKSKTFDNKDRQMAINMALNEAAENTVEVHEITDDEEQEDILLARYEKSD